MPQFDEAAPPPLGPAALLRRAWRLVTSHTSLWLIPGLAYTALQARLALGGGGAHGMAHGARLAHHMPSLKAIAPYVLGHVQALPSVGGFALVLLVQGAVLWRARREVDELSEPFAGVFADPRSLALLWVAAFLAFLLGTTAGWLLGPGAAGPRLLLFTLPAIALAQSLYTAQALTIWGDPRPHDSLPGALWRAAPALPGLLLWELALAGLFAAVLLLQARVLAQPAAHPAAAVRTVRALVVAALALRALVAWVPVILVLERCSLPRALARAAAMWQRDPLGTAAPVLALAAVFTLYAYAGTWLAGTMGETLRGPGGTRALLGYGALMLHLAGAGLFTVVYKERVIRRVGAATPPR